MTEKPSTQRTLVVFKPDSVQRGIVGEILSRFERVGLKIVGAKMVCPSKEMLQHHYEDIGKMISRRGENAFNMTVDYLMQGPVIAIVLEGIKAVEVVRKLVGTTEPMTAGIGTIRGDYAHMTFDYADQAGRSLPTLVHASGNQEEAEQEVSLWFAESEMYDYQVLHEKYTR